MRTTDELERDLQAAANQLRNAIIHYLNKAKKNLSAKDYNREIKRIAWTNRGSVSAAEHSTTNLVQNIWRQEAIERIYRGEDE